MSRLVSKFASTLSFAALLAVFTISTTNIASAVSGSDWNAGRIIDDSVFFNSTSMSTTDIQNFLNTKVPSCDTNGQQTIYDSAYGDTVTRQVYSSRRGVSTPFTCLKDYHADTSNIAPESGICGGYTGAANESAATIIYNVAQSCGISPKVILVTLQKEQSLVTDDWPWPIQYEKAMGAFCPDTSPCNSGYGGFFKQVYYGANRFKVYGANPTSFNYRANRNNTIYYNPGPCQTYTSGTCTKYYGNKYDANGNSVPDITYCGSTSVYITNQATADLYIYTPYQPNQAALNNLYGTGDLCSAYGNRNFWRMFNDWFGSVDGPAYEWQLVSQEAYSDSNRTQKFTGWPTIQPGQNIYMRVKAKNIGFETWTGQNVRLGTSNSKDRLSAFYDSSWVNNSRPASMLESTVEPSQVATFEYIMHAPSATGTYNEYFTPVIDGMLWLKDIGMYYPIHVVSPVGATNTQKTGLNSGESLAVDDYILSPDTQSSLTLQHDGNIVLYSDLGKCVWQSNTIGQLQPKQLTMQTDGNLVAYSQDGKVIWASNTSGNSGARLVIQTDGNMVIYSASNQALWDAHVIHNPDHLLYVNNTLGTGVVFPGQNLETATRKYKMIFQNDGNLVIYSPSRAIWSSGTYGNPGSRLVMQEDGNLVIYSKTGQAIWNTNSWMHGPSTLALGQDGNAILYNSKLQPTWASNTAGIQ